MTVSSPRPPASPAATSSSSPRDTVALNVTGMRCAGCVKAVEQALQTQPGVTRATVNLVTQTAIVQGEPEQINAETLATVVTEAGFPTTPRSRQTLAESAAQLDQQRQAELTAQRWRAAIAGLLLLLSAIGHLDHLGVPTLPGLTSIGFHWAIATLALVGPGRPIIWEGWQGARRRSPNMNTLVALGTLSAYTASVVALLFPRLGWECFFDEPVMLLSFILLGRLLEQQARSRAARSFQALLQLQPTTARLVPEPQPDHPDPVGVELPADQVQVGEWLRVLPGEKIPADGAIAVGRTSVNESMLTGESAPVLKQAGDSVAAGTLNQSGAITLKVTRTGAATTLAQLINLVEAAQTRKAPIQRLADTVAGYFTYGVLSLALLTFGFWFLVGTRWFPAVLHTDTHLSLVMDGMMHQAVSTTSPLLLSLKLAIAVLVVACPCALGLATPTAILVGSSLGAERGLLIRGGDVLETVHQLDTIVFDKTGTLTTGEPTVTEVVAIAPDWSEPQIMQWAVTVEQGTTHPLAKAIQRYAQAQAISGMAATDYETLPGLGVMATIEAQRVFLGNATGLAEWGVSLDQSDLQAAIARLEATGQTLIYMAVGQTVVGLIGVADTLRDDALETIQALQQQGLTVQLLTGDQPQAAAAIAQNLQLPADRVFAQVQPNQKVEVIAQLQAQGQRVGMVGDGINDAPALAKADVGISLTSGTDVAIEAADIILMGDRLTDVVKAITLSQATFRKIQQNLVWAFGYNLISLPLAAGALLPAFGIAFSPAVAGALMALSSVAVVTNSLLLRSQVKG